MISKKEVINWWIENIDKDFSPPHIPKALEKCTRRFDIDSFCWIIEKWRPNLKWRVVEKILDGTWGSRAFQIDFIESIYM